MFRTLFATILIALLPGLALAAPEIGKAAPDFTGRDADGKGVILSDYLGSIVVLEWNNPECPFVKKHYGSGNMQKLQADAHDKKVVWFTINSSAEGKQGHMTPAQAKTYLTEAKLRSDRYVLDADGKIGKLYGATATPHMFVIDTKGTLVYMGAIDDKPTPDAKDIEGATNYVKAAIDSMLAGKPVEVSSVQAYGCAVKYAN